MASTLREESYFRLIKSINAGEMYELLYQYLVLYEKLSLPGLGCIAIERKPARADFINKLFLPPSWSFVFDRSKDTPSKKLFIWLANAMGNTEWDAIKKVNDFSFELKQKINAGNVIKWDGVGVLQRSMRGEIKFDSRQIEFIYEQPVQAEKMIREDVEHIMKVGEDEKTSSEMADLLAPPEKLERSYWWAVALIVGISLIIFIGWYFSENGMTTSSAGIQKKLSPTEVPGTYKQVQ